MSLRKRDDGYALSRYSHSQPFGVGNKTSWFGSLIDNVSKLDVARNNTEIGVRYKKAADGTLKETIKSFNLDQMYNGSGPLLVKNFLEAVQKHTMGETGKTSEIFESHRDVVQLSGLAPRPVPLRSKVGPFQTETAMMISGNSAASAYCNLTLKCVYDYIDSGSIFKSDNNYCLMHGGLLLDANGKAIFERCIPNAMQRIMNGEEIKATDVAPAAKFNDVHQLGFGGSVITGRLGVEEACTGSEKALQAMHPLVQTTVVGHTPQWLGIPTIIREMQGSVPKFLVALDTQYSDRQKNTHSLGLFTDGSFYLSGKWMDVFEYEAKSDDIHIGQKIKIESAELTKKQNAKSTPYFRVIAKVKGQVADGDIYIAVNYALNPENVFAPSGFTTVCLVKFFKTDAPEASFEAKVVQPNPEMVKLSKKTFLESGSVTLDYDSHANAPEYNQEMQSFSVESQFATFVCGDVEASVDFLHAFIVHSYKMATKNTFDPLYLDIMDENWESGIHDIRQYGLPDDGSLGFNERSISNKMKQIMYMSGEMNSSTGVIFSCIGDVIGDPVGKGNRDHIAGTEQIHEFMCIHWANTFCKDKIIGNRDINKLRFLQEIPYILKPEHSSYLTSISQFQQEFANKNETNLVVLKRLLGHFCYPYVPSATVKDAQMNPMNVNKSFERDAAIVPFRTRYGDPAIHPPTIWEVWA